jgi:hypothetical protein
MIELKHRMIVEWLPSVAQRSFGLCDVVSSQTFSIGIASEGKSRVSGGASHLEVVKRYSVIPPARDVRSTRAPSSEQWNCRASSSSAAERRPRRAPAPILDAARLSL